MNDGLDRHLASCAISAKPAWNGLSGAAMVRVPSGNITSWPPSRRSRSRGAPCRGRVVADVARQPRAAAQEEGCASARPSSRRRCAAVAPPRISASSRLGWLAATISPPARRAAVERARVDFHQAEPLGTGPAAAIDETRSPPGRAARRGCAARASAAAARPRPSRATSARAGRSRSEQEPMTGRRRLTPSSPLSRRPRTRWLEVAKIHEMPKPAVTVVSLRTRGLGANARRAGRRSGRKRRCRGCRAAREGGGRAPAGIAARAHRGRPVRGRELRSDAVEVAVVAAVPNSGPASRPRFPSPAGRSMSRFDCGEKVRPMCARRTLERDRLAHGHSQVELQLPSARLPELDDEAGADLECPGQVRHAAARLVVLAPGRHRRDRG